MSEENVEIVRRGYEVFNEGGVDAIINGGIWSPEIVFDASRTGIPGVGVYRGHDEIKASSRRTGSGHSRSMSGRSTPRS